MSELQDKYIQISKQTKGVVILKLGKVESKVKSTERDTDEYNVMVKKHNIYQEVIMVKSFLTPNKIRATYIKQVF